ncbi:MAG: sigma-54 dependent transcriptional regulator, partial [Abditibacteriales bacterium]|nr:sigma-54 dependent transcriptional regulator [Abditibacteriales bacterium]
EARERARRAIQLGACDYYQKPVVVEDLKVIIARALFIRRLQIENRELMERLTDAHRFGEIIGRCPQMQQVFHMIERVATTSAPVFICGETGTGKELVARAIHQRSLRRNKPFVPINCGALPESLLESELFGHEKGAFTGAHQQRKGKFEAANGGTLFLDEIGEISPNLQVKLLRFLQDHTFERVGSTTPITVDVRVVAATNVKPEQAIAEGKLREDLYYRLCLVKIEMPPLRERGDDIELLANAFFLRARKEYGREDVRGFHPAALRAMRTYAWPGNVRELENAVRSAVIMANHTLIMAEDVRIQPTEAEPSSQEPSLPTLREAREQLETSLIRRALRQFGGNVSRAASALGVTRPALYDLMSKYGIDKEKRSHESNGQ